MEIKKLIIILFLFISFVSCQDYKELNNEEFKTAFILNSSPTFKGYFYTGTDKSFHYFISKWKYEKDRNFKIPIDKLKINEKFKFKKDKNEIKICLINDVDEEFAKSKFWKLYVMKNE